MKWLKPMTKFHGMTWHLENAQVLNNCSGRAVLISNHQSSLDMLGKLEAAFMCTAVRGKPIWTHDMGEFDRLAHTSLAYKTDIIVSLAWQLQAST